MVTFGATAVSKFLIIIVIARLSGVEQVGDFTFVLAFTLAFSFLIDFGLSWLLIREVTKRRQDVKRYINNALTMCLLLGIISLLLMTGGIHLLGYHQGVMWAVCLAGLALVVETIGNVFRAAFYAFERFELGTISIVVQEATFLMAGPAVLLLGLPFLWLFVAYLVSRLAGTLSSQVIYLKQVGSVSLQVDRPFWRELLYKAFPFAMNMALSIAYLRLDILMLSFFHGNAAVGYYEAATNIFYRFSALARMFNQSLLPLISREYAIIGPRVEKYVQVAVKYQVLLGMPLTVGALLLADKLILFLYGKEFQISVRLFQLLASVTIFRLVNNTLATTLTAVELQGKRAMATGLLAGVNVLLNLFLIPRYSSLGASISTVVAEICFFLALYIFLIRVIPRITTLETLVKPALSCGVMAVALLLLRDLPLLFLIPLGGVVYVFSLSLLRTFSDSERRVLLNMMRVGKKRIERAQSATVPNPTRKEE
jgi:O-antigen/teichoic acid export membrane protein